MHLMQADAKTHQLLKDGEEAAVEEPWSERQPKRDGGSGFGKIKYSELKRGFKANTMPQLLIHQVKVRSI